MKFNSRQSDTVRRSRKNTIVSRINFALQISRAICTVVFTNGKTFDANIFTSRLVRTSRFCNFMRGHALPLSLTKVLRLAQISPLPAQHPARRSRNGRTATCKTSRETSHAVIARLLGDGHATATAAMPVICQDGSQANRPRDRARPRRNSRDISQDSRAAGVRLAATRSKQHLASGLQEACQSIATITPKNYEPNKPNPNNTRS